jgi:hypothetical protein
LKKFHSVADERAISPDNNDRRATVRYIVAAQVEVWPQGVERPQIPALFRAKNISLQGFYLVADEPIEIEHRFNFVLRLPDPLTRKPVTAWGVARIVRREQLFVNQRERFGLAAKIDRVLRLAEPKVA